MKKHLALALFLGLNVQAQSKDDIRLVDFSDKYTGTVSVAQDEEAETNCTVNLYDKNGNKIFSEPAFLSEFDLDEGNRARTNIKELPYGEQSILIFEDFNFDGQEDIALRTGFFSCYGGPSYAVYLAQGKGFVYNESFSELGQNYCGMFQVDTDKKQLHTMTKSGCCWHEFATYEVYNDTVVPVEVIEEQYSGMFVDYKVSKRENGKMKDSFYQVFDTGDKTPEFMLNFENGKKMYLTTGMNDDLYYVFTDKDQKVELAYNDAIVYHRKNNTFSFTNRKTTYIVSENEILIKDSGKEYRMNKVKERKGAFSNLNVSAFYNVTQK